jgi:hypothetical protein
MAPVVHKYPAGLVGLREWQNPDHFGATNRYVPALEPPIWSLQRIEDFARRPD